MVLGSLSAGVGEVNAGSVVELFSSADTMLGLVSVVSEANTGSGFGVIGALWASRGISVDGVSPVIMFARHANTIIITTTPTTTITAITKKTMIAIVVVVVLMSIVVVVVVAVVAVFIAEVMVFVVVEVVAVRMVEVTVFVVVVVVEVDMQTFDDIDPEEPVNMST